MPSMGNEYMKNYYAVHHSESIKCELCGGKYRKFFKSVHEKSKKHSRATVAQIAKTESDKEREIRELNDKINTLKSTIRIMYVYGGG